MKCPNCGADIVAGQKFCNKCGFRLDTANQATGNKQPDQSQPSQNQVNQSNVTNNNSQQTNVPNQNQTVNPTPQNQQVNAGNQGQPNGAMQQNQQMNFGNQNQPNGSMPQNGQMNNNMGNQNQPNGSMPQNGQMNNNMGNNYQQPFNPNQQQMNGGNYQQYNNNYQQPNNNNSGQSIINEETFHKMVPFAQANYGMSLLPIPILIALYLFTNSIVTLIVAIAIIVGWYFATEKYSNNSMPLNNSFESIFLFRKSQNQQTISKVTKLGTIIASAINLIFIFIGTYVSSSSISDLKQFAESFGADTSFLKSHYSFFSLFHNIGKFFDFVRQYSDESSISNSDIQKMEDIKTWLSAIIVIAIVGPLLVLIFSFVKTKFSRLLRVTGAVISTFYFILLNSVIKELFSEMDNFVISMGFSATILVIAAIVSLIFAFTWAIREKRNFQ